MNRVLCRLFGHPDSRLHWGPWRRSPEGEHRVVTEECARCGSILSLSSILRSEWSR